MTAGAVFALVVALLLLADGLRVRGRIAALPVLAPSDVPVDPAHRFLTAPGVILDDATRRAASAHAKKAGLDALDLWPPELPALDAMGYAALVDPRTYRKDRLTRGRTAAHAVLVAETLLRRAGLEGTKIDSRPAFIEVADRLKRYACTTTDLAVAPGLRAVPTPSNERLAALRAALGGATTVYLVWQPFFLGVLVLFAALAELPWGLFPLAAFHLQALLAIGGTAITSRDLLLAFAGRSVLELLRWGELIALPQKDAKRADPSEALRPVYQELLKDGIDRFFEPRRESCPLCEGKELHRFIELPDFFQRKPGRFRLERCRGCGHIFQNPRLSIAGLDFYYKDFYEGLGGDGLDTIFGFSGAPYVARVKELVGVAAPTRWLDVGGGHGHFCNTARDTFPKCAFDGLDMGEAMAEGARRGWVDEAFLGLFPELAPKLAGRYDVVSMSHYLEHTRDQRAEIAAAAIALKEGGHFLVEVPDPECPIGKVLGGFWLPWFQPQHQHLTSAANMRKLLLAAGFEVVKEVRGPAHIPVDLAFATVILMKRLAPDPAQPWRPRDPAAVRLWGGLVWTLGLPILGLAYVTDRLLAPLFRGSARGNAYRMLARKPSADDPPLP